jgi:hypothetical protein
LSAAGPLPIGTIRRAAARAFALILTGRNPGVLTMLLTACSQAITIKPSSQLPSSRLASPISRAAP